MTLRHTVAAVLCLLVFTLQLQIAPIVSQANAQSSEQAVSGETSTALRARQQQLLVAMLQAPDNLDLAFEYAAVAAQNGDYEAAIGTLERMLIYAPGLARVQLELGVLYFRLGSNDAARSYFEAALTAPNVPPEVRARVDTFLAAIDEAENPADFRATVVAGVRAQTNANAAPGQRQVSLNGRSFVLDETSTGQSDLNLFAASSIHGAYDLGRQGDLLEADLILYGARYREVSRLDTFLAELTFGPSFNLARFNIDNARLGIYGIANGVRLDYANYSGSLGAGVRIAVEPDVLTKVDAKFEWRKRWYRDTLTSTTLSDRSGYLARGEMTVTRRISAAFSARALILGDFEEARKAWVQSWETGFGLGGTYKFGSPIAALPDQWSIDLEAGYIRRVYQGADPLVNANEVQKDHEGWARASLLVPLRQNVALGLTGELRRQYSNYDLASYTNASATVSLMKAF